MCKCTNTKLINQDYSIYLSMLEGQPASGRGVGGKGGARGGMVGQRIRGRGGERGARGGVERHNFGHDQRNCILDDFRDSRHDDHQIPML